MDYAHIIQTADAADSFHVPKQDSKDILLGIRDEIEKAKAFLCIPSSTINVTLFDHLAAVLAKIIREKVENAVDVIENISQSVKIEKYSRTAVKTALIEKSKPNEKLLKYIKDMQDLFKNAVEYEDINLDIKHPEEDEEEPPEEEDIVEDDSIEEGDIKNLEEKEKLKLRSVMPDLCYHMNYFREAGIGVSSSETLRINISLKALAVNLKLESLRFWGKIFGICNDYYIAETPFKEGIKQEEFGWRSSNEPSHIIPRPESEMEDEITTEEEPGDAEEAGDADNEDEEAPQPELKYVTIPPIPPMKLPTYDFAPADENGTGVNKNLYFVCIGPGYPWICLPRCIPEQIIAARQTRKCFTGKLDAEVRGYPLFPGKEAHYLRAQIARISAGTNLCPKNYYIISTKPDVAEDEEANEEETAETEGPEESEEISDVIKINADYKALPVDVMFAECPKQWIHAKPAILKEGCSSLIVNIKVEDAAETEDTGEVQDEAIQEEKPTEKPDQDIKTEEEQIQLLRSISHDKCGGGLIPWTYKLCSNLMTELAVLLLRSNVWPGAYIYYSGKSFENIYIGLGQKYSTRHYAPVLPVTHVEEYPHGLDITEHDYSAIPAEEESELEGSTEQEETES